MAKAFVKTKDGKEAVIAESDDTLRIEGNYYFPPDSVRQDLLVDSDMHTTCHWKGEASYKTIKVGDETWPDGAFYYPQPVPGSIERVKKDFGNYYAFWRGVETSP